MSKIKIEDIQAELSEYNWKLISKEYLNLDSMMEFECDEGHRVISSWKKLRGGPVCPICKQNKHKTINFDIKPKKRDVYRILALDQATRISGWSVYDDEELIAYGAYQLEDGLEEKRINEAKNWLLNMITIWQPDFIELEGIQYQQNQGVTTFQTLARLQGVLINLCYELEIEHDIVNTNTWRNHCGVKGRTRADKKQSMKRLAKEWYDVSISDDEADAIGIGKYACHFHKGYKPPTIGFGTKKE